LGSKAGEADIMKPLHADPAEQGHLRLFYNGPAKG